MEKLKENYRRTELTYKLLRRNDMLCIYGISGTYTNSIIHYVVMLIRIRLDKYRNREAIPSDEEFGKSKPDCTFQNLTEAEEYFDRWTSKLMKGVKEKVKVVPEYHLRVKTVILDKKSIRIRERIKNWNKDYHRLTI